MALTFHRFDGSHFDNLVKLFDAECVQLRAVHQVVFGRAKNSSNRDDLSNEMLLEIVYSQSMKRGDGVLRKNEVEVC